MSQDIIVEILRYGKAKKPGKELGFKFDDISNHLKTKGFAMDYEETQTLSLILSNCFILNVPTDGLYVMKAESYFNLLEFEELEEARRSSKQANYWAITALTVSIFGTLCSIILSVRQINSSIVINQKQFQELIKTIDEQNRELDSLYKIK